MAKDRKAYKKERYATIKTKFESGELLHPEEKVCIDCLHMLPRHKFGVAYSNPSGLQSYCLECGRDRMLLREYGLTRDDYNDMLKRQNYVCAHCQGEETRFSRLAVDHCHTTGQVRALLCTNCNLAEGYLASLGFESPALLAFWTTVAHNLEVS